MIPDQILLGPVSGFSHQFGSLLHQFLHRLGKFHAATAQSNRCMFAFVFAHLFEYGNTFAVFFGDLLQMVFQVPDHLFFRFR